MHRCWCAINKRTSGTFLRKFANHSKPGFRCTNLLVRTSLALENKCLNILLLSVNYDWNSKTKPWDMWIQTSTEARQCLLGVIRPNIQVFFRCPAKALNKMCVCTVWPGSLVCAQVGRYMLCNMVILSLFTIHAIPNGHNDTCTQQAGYPRDLLHVQRITVSEKIKPQSHFKEEQVHF